MAYFVLSISLILLTLVAWWMADRRARVIPGKKARCFGRLLFAVFFLSMALYPIIPLARFLVGTEPFSLPVLWVTSAYLWMPLVLPAASTIWIGLNFAQRAYGFAFRKNRRARTETKTDRVADASNANAPCPARSLSRREALQLAGAAIPPLITCGVTAAAIAQRGNFRVRRVNIPIASLPPDLDGVTICQLTDLHAGNFFPTDAIPRIADAANALKTDLVVFTGDLIDRGLLDRIPDGMRLIDNLDRRHGFAMIEGNHDVQSSPHGFQREMRGRNLPFLLDGQIEFRIPGRGTAVQFLGIPWGDANLDLDTPTPSNPHGRQRARGMAASVQRVAAMRRPDSFPILLAHHPHAFDPAVEADLPLTLAGHSHGGQVMLTRSVGIGPLRFRYWAGEHERNGNHMVISNGLGSWFPLRLNAPAEILHITLVRA